MQKLLTPETLFAALQRTPLVLFSSAVYSTLNDMETWLWKQAYTAPVYPVQHLPEFAVYEYMSSQISSCFRDTNRS